MTETKTYATPEEVRRAGWNALVAALGPTNATRFILQYERGHHDYAMMREELFGNQTVEILYKKISREDKT